MICDEDAPQPRRAGLLKYPPPFGSQPPEGVMRLVAAHLDGVLPGVLAEVAPPTPDAPSPPLLAPKRVLLFFSRWGSGPRSSAGGRRGCSSQYWCWRKIKWLGTPMACWRHPIRVRFRARGYGG